MPDEMDLETRKIFGWPDYCPCGDKLINGLCPVCDSEAWQGSSLHSELMEIESDWGFEVF